MPVTILDAGFTRTSRRTQRSNYSEVRGTGGRDRLNARASGISGQHLRFAMR